MKSERVIPAGSFKAKCLALLDEVKETGRPIVVTKRGRPVARVVAAAPEAIRSLKGSVRRERDLVRPTGEAWRADR
jgi:prevent-host-death family protein